MGRSKQITEDDLLDAAMRVIIRDGLPSLTIEATANEAGVSKGGVLYSFRSKDDLLRALVRRSVAHIDRDIKAHCTTDKNPVGRWMRGYLAASQPQSAESGGQSVAELQQLHAALLAAVAMNPKLIQGVRDYVDRWNRSAVE